MLWTKLVRLRGQFERQAGLTNLELRVSIWQRPRAFNSSSPSPDPACRTVCSNLQPGPDASIANFIMYAVRVTRFRHWRSIRGAPNCRCGFGEPANPGVARCSSERGHFMTDSASSGRSSRLARMAGRFARELSH